MKKLVLTLALASLAAGAAVPALGATVISGAAGASLVTAIAITKSFDMYFGDVSPGPTPGTVSLTPAAATVRAATGGTILGNVTTTHSAAFLVNGAANATYAITIPSSVSLIKGGDFLLVNGFTSAPSATGTLSGVGGQTLYVAATLQVPANQVLGAYTANFNVTVSYN